MGCSPVHSIDRMLDAGQLEKHSRKIVLHAIGQDADGLNGLFE